jgi:hypothetical protein
MWNTKARTITSTDFRQMKLLINCRMCVDGCGSRLEAIGLDGYEQPVWNRWKTVECLRPRKRGNHGIMEKVVGPEVRLE